MVTPKSLDTLGFGSNLCEAQLSAESSSMSSYKKVFQRKVCAIVGAPVAHGQPIGGVENGPDSIRDAKVHNMIQLAGWSISDRGNVSVKQHQTHSSSSCEATREPDDCDSEDFADMELVENTPQCLVSKGYIKQVDKVGFACGSVYEAVRNAALESKFVLTLGGDHGLAAGSIAGMLSVYPDLAVVWIDAHADCNTPLSSPSGNFHGMPAAHLLGWFGNEEGELPDSFAWAKGFPRLSEERLALVGLRSVDENEKQLLNKSKVSCYSMSHIDRIGLYEVMLRALKAVDPNGNRPLHLSFDIDACDPSIAFGTGTLCRGGFTYREAHLIAEVMHETGRLVSMDLVEVNPHLDVEDSFYTASPASAGRPASPERSSRQFHGDRITSSPTDAVAPTARLAVDIIGSALGTSIL